GAILCAILTGQPPYVGADAEATIQLAARARLDDAFARLAACGAEPELVALCRRCLAAERADRPADAGGVAQAVADLRAAAGRGAGAGGRRGGGGGGGAAGRGGGGGPRAAQAAAGAAGPGRGAGAAAAGRRRLRLVLRPAGDAAAHGGGEPGAG